MVMRGLVLLALVVAAIYLVMNPDHVKLFSDWAMTTFHR
jgi:hypothetical protein